MLSQGNICKHIKFILTNIIKDFNVYNKINGRNYVSIHNICKLYGVSIDKCIENYIETSSISFNEGHKEICAICYENNVDFCINCDTCRGKFHVECIKNYMRTGSNKKYNCPLCRSSLNNKISTLQLNG